MLKRRGWDSNPRFLYRNNCLAGSPFQPLTHLSDLPRRGLEPLQAFAHKHLKLACLPIPPPRPIQDIYSIGKSVDFSSSGSCWGGVLMLSCFSSCLISSLSSTDFTLVFLEAMIINIRVNTINKTAKTVVILPIMEAAPRGPKVDWLPAPPNAPARSALFPLCNNTTMINNRHTNI